MRNLLIVFLALFYCSPAVAACTDGTDCYCDLTAPGSGDALADASQVYCRDFDAAGLYLNPGSNNWASIKGITHTCNRGSDSEWQNAYGQPVQRIWDETDPASAYTGCVCDVNSGFTQCVGAIEYCSAAQGTDAGIGGDSGTGANCWGSASYDANAEARIDIQDVSNLDYKDEIASLAGPTYAAAHSNYHLAMRIPAGKTGGILESNQSFGSTISELGTTLLVAYSSNLESSMILTEPWKNDELGTSPATFNNNMFPLNHTSGNCSYQEAADPLTIPNVGERKAAWPFCAYFASRTLGQSPYEGDCVSVSYNSGASTGTITCDGTSFMRVAPGGNWDGRTDWPLDEWVCVRGHIEGYHTTTTRLRIWVSTDVLTDELVLDIVDWDTSAAGNSETPDGFTFSVMDSYANANVPSQGAPDTLSTVYRHQDNMHMREGSPVSCAQVGFVAGASAVPGGTGLTITDGIILQ